MDEWFHELLAYVSLGSVALQLYVIALILLASPASMSSYRYFLFLYTALDMAFTFICGVVIGPDPIMVNAYAAKGAQVKGIVRYLGQFWCNIATSLGAACASGLVAAQCYCLIYRFLAILNNRRYYNAFLSIPSLICFHCLGAVIAAIVGSLFLLGLTADSSVALLIARYHEAASTLDESACIVYFSSTSSTSWAIFGALGCGIVMAELASFTLAFGILRTLRKNVASFSAKTYRMHLQLTLLLVLQISTPVVFVVLPAVVTMVAAARHYAVGQLPGRILLVLLVALYAPINSVLTISFITPYRQFTLQILGKIYRAVLPASAADAAVPPSNAVVGVNVSTVVDSIQMNRVVQSRRHSYW